MDAEVLSDSVLKICPSCKNDLENEEDLIQCDECHSWYHGLCVDLLSEQIESLLSSNGKWFCVNCSLQSQAQSTAEGDSTANVIICPRCPPEKRVRTFKGKRGLKIHYARLHKDHMIDLDLEHASNTPTIDLQSFVQSIGILKRRVKVLKRIPKGARMTAALKLSSLLDDCLSNSLVAWISLFCFSFNALCVPEKSSNLTQSVKNNISTYDISKSMFDTNVTRKLKNKKSNLSSRVESKISEGDVRGAVKILSSSDTLAQDTHETFLKLKAKHPTPSRPLCFPDAPTAGDSCLTVTEKEVIEGVLAFPNGSSAGIDGIRPQHLKDLLSISNGDAARKLLTSLTKFCNFLLSGNVNSEVTNVLYGATICALNKKRRRNKTYCCGMHPPSLGF